MAPLIAWLPNLDTVAGVATRASPKATGEATPACASPVAPLGRGDGSLGERSYVAPIAILIAINTMVNAPHSTSTHPMARSGRPCVTRSR